MAPLLAQAYIPRETLLPSRNNPANTKVMGITSPALRIINLTAAQLSFDMTPSFFAMNCLPE